MQPPVVLYFLNHCSCLCIDPITSLTVKVSVLKTQLAAISKRSLTNSEVTAVYIEEKTSMEKA